MTDSPRASPSPRAARAAIAAAGSECPMWRSRSRAEGLPFEREVC
jgi:hypothetical protein